MLHRTREAVQRATGLAAPGRRRPAPPLLPLPSPQAYHQQYLSKGGRFNRPQSAEKGCKDKSEWEGAGQR